MERISEACGPSYYTYQVTRHSTEMLQGLNQQRKNGGRFCDVLLRVGDDSFPAHRAVLAACSEYFESVFSAQSNMGNGSDGSSDGGGSGCRELEMHTISPKVFGDILDFAYTSRIVVRLESFPELMTAAKFLVMRSVIDICQEVIKQSNVQILVPPSRADIMLFRPGGDLGFPLDMTHSQGMSSNGIAGSMQDEDSVRPGAAIGSQSSLPLMQGVDRLSMVAGQVSPQLLASPFQNISQSIQGLSSSSSSKRGRGRPRKASMLDSVLFGGPGGLRETGILPCGLCGKVFTDAVRLRQHEAQHGVTSIQLGYGDLASPPRHSENGLLGQDNPEQSQKRNRSRKQVACELCGKIFRDVYHLNRHKLSHSGEKPYSCPVCGLRFKRKDRMSYHVRSHDGSVGKPYICQSCGKGFSRPDHLNGHIKQVHTSERPHKCEVGTVGTRADGKGESRTMASIPLSVGPIVTRAGDQATCNASFATRDRLRSHLACHEDKVPCQVCGKYLRAAYMADHLKKHSEGPSNFCSICNREGKCPHQEPMESSDSYGELSDASEIKTPEKQNNGSFTACEIIAAKTKLESDSEKKYPCQECGSLFRSKSYLNKHIHKVHMTAMGSALADLGPTLGPALGPTLGPALGPTLGPALGPALGHALGPGLGPALGSPFSPQQNMSLLESFGFQIVQSAFASSLVGDPDVKYQPMGQDGK